MFVAVFLLVLLAACSGGDSADPSPLAGKILNWTAPLRYIDGTPLDPGSELQCFEIYVKESPAFGEEDTAFVWVGPMDRTFDLSQLDVELPNGARYYVSVRAVTMFGAKSPFSEIVSFSL